MKLHDAIIAGITSLWQNKLRAALSLLGIFIGIASVLCMIAIGGGAKEIVVRDIEKLGGANQVRFWTRTAFWERGRLVRRTTERYTLEDIYAIEAECSDVLFALSKTDRYFTSVSNRHGSQIRAIVEGVTPDYAQGLHWQIQHGRFFSQDDIDTARQVCVLGSDIAIDLFNDVSPLGQEVKIRFRWRQPAVRYRVIGVMQPKGRSLHINMSLDDFICLPLTTHQQRFSGTRYIEGIIVFFKKDADVQEVIDSVKYVLRKRHRGKGQGTQT